MKEIIKANSAEKFPTSSLQLTEWCNRLNNTLASVREAQDAVTPTVGWLVDNQKKEYHRIFIALLKRTIKYFGINPETDPSVSNEQITDLVVRFTRTHRYWTLADIVMCFNRVKESPNLYGRFYGRVDASVIMGWFSMYESEMQAVNESKTERLPHTPSPNDISEDLYMESLLAKAAGGDAEASKQYHFALETRRQIAQNNGLLAVYRWDRIHKYDEEQTKTCRR